MRYLLAALAALASLSFITPAHALLEGGDIICESTTTAGVGTVNLDGAITDYVTFVSQITSGATVPYHIVSGDGKRETGIGTFTDAAPDTLSRTATWSTDGSGAELTLSGTSTVCLGPITELFSVGGNFNAYADAGANSLWGWDDVAGRYENLTGAESLVAIFGTPADDQVAVADSASATTWRTLADSDLATQKLQYDQATNTFSAGTDDDIPDAADFTNLTGGTGITNSPTGTINFDATELTTVTWGANNFTTEVYSTDGVDLTWDYSTTDAVATLSGGGTTPGIFLDDQGFLRFSEEDAGGTEYKAFQAPATLTASTTCTFEDDANFIPDSCVGDGTDDDIPDAADYSNLTGGTGITNNPTGTINFDATELTTTTWGANNYTTAVFSTDGIDLTWDYSTTDGVAILSGGGSTPGIFLDDQGFLRFSEEDAGGTEYKAFQAPATLTASTTCTFEDDANFIPDSCVGDGTDDDIPDAADYSNLTGGTGITNNPTGTINFDATEVTTATWGANNFTTMVFSTDGVDLTWDYSTTDAVAILSGGGTSPGIFLDDQGFLRFSEEDANGSNYKAFQAPATVTADTTCTFEDDANFIPDSCVGDGTDDDIPDAGDYTNLTGGTGITNNPTGTINFDATEVTPSVTWGAGSFTTMAFDAGATDPTFTFGSDSLAITNASTITQTAATPHVSLIATDAGVGSANLYIRHNTASPAANDIAGSLYFSGKDSNGNDHDYVSFVAVESAVTDGSEGVTLSINAVPSNNGTGVSFVLGDRTYPNVQFYNTSAGSGGPLFQWYQNSSTPAAADEIAQLDFEGNDSVPTQQRYGLININILDPNTGTEDGAMDFYAMINGSQSKQFSIANGVALPAIASDATHTDNTVCADTTTKVLYAGSGTGGICLGTSSARYKHDIKPLADRCEAVMALEPKAFRYNKGYGDSGAKEQYGFLAEDVVKVMPELVGFDMEGRPNSVDMLALTPVIVYCMKKQQQSMASLNDRISRLEQGKGSK